MDKKEIKLSRPIQISGANVTTLTMREPLVQDQLTIGEIAGSDARKELALFANLCGVAPGDLERLPMRDYGKLQDAYKSFIS